jgi:RNase P subunit RPR2
MDDKTTCTQHGHQYQQAGTSQPSDMIIVFCIKCADVKRIPVKE